MQTQQTKQTVRFSAKLQNSAVTLPKGANLPQGQVEGIINTYPFRANIEKDRLTISEALRQAAAAQPGDEVAIEITRVGDEPEVRIPKDLEDALQAVPEAGATWHKNTPLARRDWVLFITTAKLEETRQRRIEKAASVLGEGRKRNCCFGGLNWLTKDHKSVDTWLPLPGAQKL